MSRLMFITLTLLSLSEREIAYFFLDARKWKRTAYSSMQFNRQISHSVFIREEYFHESEMQSTEWHGFYRPGLGKRLLMNFSFTASKLPIETITPQSHRQTRL